MTQAVSHLAPPPSGQSVRSVYGFATPALGNEALQAAVREMGWHSRIRNYISPGQQGRQALLAQREALGPQQAHVQHARHSWHFWTGRTLPLPP